MDLPNVYYGLSRAYRFLERYQMALPFMRRAQRLQRVVLPLNSCDYARTVAGTATIYAVLGDYRRELIYYRKALVLYQRSLPTQEHIDMARSLSRLGLAYYHNHQYTNALSHLNKSLAISIRTAPEVHPHTADVLTLLGLVHMELGNLEQTSIFFQKALAMRQTCLPSDHPGIAYNYHILANLYEKRGNDQLAFDYALKTLATRKLKLPEDHSMVQEAISLVERLTNN
jgi:tetratricopeptide (TPR) repeat protein